MAGSRGVCLDLDGALFVIRFAGFGIEGRYSELIDALLGKMERHKHGIGMNGFRNANEQVINPAPAGDAADSAVAQSNALYDFGIPNGGEPVCEYPVARA